MKQSKSNINKSSGFSFVELMVVIALVGILSAIGLPNFLAGLPEKRLKGATRNMFSDLQKARLLAVKNNEPVTFTFNTTDPEKPFYSYANLPNVALEQFSPSIRYGCEATETDWNDPPVPIPANGVSVTTIQFMPLGTANESTVYLQTQNNREVCFAVHTTQFGAVKIRRYSGTWEK
ncbi:MAG: prepilin-type N-terminal cleavage/methylation domain-containing protein [Candidatus Electrothrix sp. AR4]|nr:prepilin-type N-terminal cleavage/methylation domain-containing protein [Candidatus Electrothrix sp. AR4]